MNGNVKNIVDEAIFSSSNPMLVFQDKIFNNISKYLKEKYITFSINCDESFSNVEDVIGNDKDAAGWYKRLCEISQKHGEEKVVVIFDNFEELDDTIGKVFLDYVIGDKRLEFPENVKLVLNSNNKYYDNIYLNFSNYCDLLRISKLNKVFVLPLEAKQRDKKKSTIEPLGKETTKSSENLVKSVDIEPETKKAIDHVLYNSSAPIYITNRVGAPCFEYLKSISKSVVFNCKLYFDRYDPILRTYRPNNPIVRATYDQKTTLSDICKKFPFLEKDSKIQHFLYAPKWYIELCEKCWKNPKEKILMVFNNIECLDSMYYNDLAKSTLPNYSVWRNWVLPKNAQLVFIDNNDYFSYDQFKYDLIKNNSSNVFVGHREIWSRRFDENIISEVKQNEIDELLETTSEPVLLLDGEDASATRYLKNEYKFVSISASEYNIVDSNDKYAWYNKIVKLSKETDEKVLMIFDDDNGLSFRLEDIIFSKVTSLPSNVQIVFSVTTDNYSNVISSKCKSLSKKCVVVDNRDKELLISGIIHGNEDMNKKI